MMTTIELEKLVKQRRKELRMSQSDLAMVSVAGRRFISDLENGKESCELGLTLRVLANLGIDLAIQPRSHGDGATA